MARRKRVFLTAMLLIFSAAAFTSEASAEAPVLISPADGAVIFTEAGTPDLTYTCPRSNFGGYVNSWLFYDVQIATDPSNLTNDSENVASRKEVSPSNCSATPYSWTGIPSPGTYYWRVVGESTSGGTFFVSAIHSFTIRHSVDIFPTNLSPANGARILLPEGESRAEIGSIAIRFKCPRYSTPYGSEIDYTDYHVAGATSPLPGPNGFPSDTYESPFLAGAPKPTNAAETECETENAYYLEPGTYYWQPYARDCLELSGACNNKGHIWSFTIVQQSEKPPVSNPPSKTVSIRMSRRNAETYARKMVRSRRPSARGIRPRCSRLSKSKFYCSPNFLVRSHVYLGGLVVRHYQVAGKVFWRGNWRRLTKLT